MRITKNNFGIAMSMDSVYPIFWVIRGQIREYKFFLAEPFNQQFWVLNKEWPRERMTISIYDCEKDFYCTTIEDAIIEQNRQLNEAE